MIYDVANYKKNDDMEGMDEVFYIISDYESTVFKMLQGYSDKAKKVLTVCKHPVLEYEAYQLKGEIEYSVFMMQNSAGEETILFPENCSDQIKEYWRNT